MALGRMESFDRGTFLDLLEASGQTRAQLAVACGVGASVIAHWVSGRSKPSPQMAPRLAAALGVGVLDLAGKTMATADLTDLRMMKGINGGEAAERAGLKPSQFQALEAAITMPKPDHLDALADVYEVSVDQVRRAWVNRRVTLYGTHSLGQLTSEAREYLAPWADDR